MVFVVSQEKLPCNTGRELRRGRAPFRPRFPSEFLHRHRERKCLRRRDWQQEKSESRKQENGNLNNSKIKSKWRFVVLLNVGLFKKVFEVVCAFCHGCQAP